MKVTANPASPRLNRWVRDRLVLLRPWDGAIYRITSLDYPSAAEILSGAGSYRHGGRWNAMGAMRTVYGSTSDVVAVAESRATCAYAGLPEPLRAPQLLVTIELRLDALFDLTGAEARQALADEFPVVGEEDWRKAQDNGWESLSQALGRAIFRLGGEGLLVPSARVSDGVNLAYFPEALKESSCASVHEGGKLERLASRTRE